ncbi:MAG: hypothetical protein GYA51_12330 [Candidatus Methanofastidiosa archaeon]|nr:hypothetical protein [Candidatus Methanofastidiosa archaeon]
MNSTYNELYKIAEAQGGYFTVTQAKSVGFSPQGLFSLKSNNRFKHITYGIYRITHYPSSEYEDIMIAVLKSGPKAVVSHDTALAVYQLSDIMPAIIHLTIPKNRFRGHKEIRYHTARITPKEITNFNGLPITTVERTITDVIRSGMDATLIRQAIEQAIQRGMITKPSLTKQASQYGEKIRNEVNSFLGK